MRKNASNPARNGPNAASPPPLSRGFSACFVFVQVASTQQQDDILIPTYPREHLMPQKLGVARDVFVGFVSYVIALFHFHFFFSDNLHNTHSHIYLLL